MEGAQSGGWTEVSVRTPGTGMLSDPGGSLLCTPDITRASFLTCGESPTTINVQTLLEATSPQREGPGRTSHENSSHGPQKKVLEE